MLPAGHQYVAEQEKMFNNRCIWKGSSTNEDFVPIFFVLFIINFCTIKDILNTNHFYRHQGIENKFWNSYPHLKILVKWILPVFGQFLWTLTLIFSSFYAWEIAIVVIISNYLYLKLLENCKMDSNTLKLILLAKNWNRWFCIRFCLTPALSLINNCWPFFFS